MSGLPPGRTPFGGVLLALGMACTLGSALLLTGLDMGGGLLAPAGGTGTESSSVRGSAVPISAITVLPAITRPAVSQHLPPGPTAPWPTALSSDTPTPTAVSVFPVACEPPAGWVPVLVQPGDTLVLLAMRSATTLEALRIANCLADTIIQPGQTIYVPAQPLFTPTVSPQCYPPYGWVFYVVRPGDTMFSIAARYGLSVSQLMFANCRSNYTVYVGETLYVPWVNPTATATWTAVPTATPMPPTDTPEPPPDPTRTPRPPTPTATGTTAPPPSGTPTPTDTPIPPTPTDTPIPPTLTDTPVPPTPTDTPVPPTPTDTPIPPTPTDTPAPPTPTDTPAPPTPTDTPAPPTPTDTPVPPTP